jgi:hypothetical protein
MLTLIAEAKQVRDFSNKFCKHLKSLITRKKLLLKIQNNAEYELLGEAKGTYNDKIQKNEIFTDRELQLVSLIKNYFSDKKILEIGCGVGQISIFLKLCNIDIEACDFTPHREGLTKQMCETFNINLAFYNKPFQELNLEKYDLLIAANVRSPKNNFLNDKIIFENFLKRQDRYVILDWNDYSTTNDDKAELEIFCNEQINKVLSTINQQNRYAAL